MYTKRSNLPKEVPLPRKGTKYVSTASHFSNKKMPLLFVLRDILKIARTKHEAKKICLGNNVKINGKVRKDLNFPVGLKDFVQVGDKYFEVGLEKGKYSLFEVKSEKKRILKVIGKRILKGNKIQANLEDGTNILTKESFSVGDSFVLTIGDNKLLRIIKLKEGADVEIIKGKYTGSKGKIISSEDSIGKKMFKVKLGKGEVFVSKESLLAVE